MKERDKRTAILRAAAAVFAAKGFHPATVEEIAARAGVGKGTVYEYFSSKKELFRELLRAGMESYLAAVRKRLEASGPAREVLTEIARAHFRFAAEHGALARLLFEGQGGPASWAGEWLKEAQDRKLAVLIRIIARGIARGEFRPVDPRLAAQIFLGALGALCLPLFLGSPGAPAGGPAAAADAPGFPCDLQAQLEQGLDLLFRGLALQAPPQD
ncbi:MAG: TetR/AcrR family transcriptional regulator [Firmicutes bacterium]|nr:TetR/AcrR family transcriptional regulator [Bacillota bacterium]